MRIIFILLMLQAVDKVMGVETYLQPTGLLEISGRPLEVSLTHLILSYQNSRPSTQNPDQNSDQNVYFEERDRLLNHLQEDNLVQEFVNFLQLAGPLELQALRDLGHRLVSKIRFQEPDNKELNALGSKILEILPPASLTATYEYAYGKELERKVVKQFEAIHRQTLFENKEHGIEIDLDFLSPVKKLVQFFKIQEKFSWLWEQSLRFAYRAKIKHSKKIFTRSLGYYDKVSVKIEILRRKRSFWGDGPWEVYGHTYQAQELPRAILTTEIKEL